MSSNVKSDFAIMCRSLRIQKGFKQREVASFIGVKPSSYGNVESSAFKVVGAEKVSKIGELYRLTPTEFQRLTEAWERCPLSPYGEKQRKHWERRNRMRSKAKHHDRVFRSLLDVLGAFLPHIPDDHLCTCEFGGEAQCEICSALENLGLRPITSRDQVMADLAKLQDRLEAKDDSACESPDQSAIR